MPVVNMYRRLLTLKSLMTLMTLLFTSAEVWKALSSLANGKAPGEGPWIRGEGKGSGS